MTGEGMVKLSQCMIVKNEEKNIAKALAWAKGLAWEQIVVDTGSTDRTVELAREMGARIYHYDWTDDFAAAKNYAISKAKGQWIAFLDADEIPALGDEQKLLTMLKNLDARGIDGISTAWLQLDDQGQVAAAGTQIRIFRNTPGLCYRRRIHEQLGYRDGRSMKIADATETFSILHSGYCGEAWKKKKTGRRNLDLILKELEENPLDHEMMGYLGDEYRAAEEVKEAQQWYERSIEAMPDHLDDRDQRSAATFLYLLELSGAAGADEKRMLEIYIRASDLLPKEADFDYVMGQYFISAEQYDKGAYYLGQALEKAERYGSNNRAMMVMANLQSIYENLALCSYKTGDLQKVVSLCTAILRENRVLASVLSILLRAFRDGGVSGPDAEHFLRKIYDFDSSRERLLLLRMSQMTEYEKLERELESLFTAEELACARKAWKGEKNEI